MPKSVGASSYLNMGTSTADCKYHTHIHWSFTAQVSLEKVKDTEVMAVGVIV